MLPSRQRTALGVPLQLFNLRLEFSNLTISKSRQFTCTRSGYLRSTGASSRHRARLTDGSSCKANRCAMNSPPRVLTSTSFVPERSWAAGARVLQNLFDWIQEGVHVRCYVGGDNVYQFVQTDELAEARIFAARRPGSRRLQLRRGKRRHDA